MEATRSWLLASNSSDVYMNAGFAGLLQELALARERIDDREKHVCMDSLHQLHVVVWCCTNRL